MGTQLMPGKRIVEGRHQNQDALSQLRREIAAELAYLLEGFFTGIEARYFELAGQRASNALELSDTIRELLSRRQDITHGFGPSVVASVDNWLYCGKEDVNPPGDKSFVAESVCSARAHFAEVLGQIDQRSRELLNNGWNLKHVPVAPEPLCCRFVAICEEVCTAEISLHATAILFRQLVLERLGNLYGKIYRVLIATDDSDHALTRRPEEFAEMKGLALLHVSA
jgi:hypothetical protein